MVPSEYALCFDLAFGLERDDGPGDKKCNSGYCHDNMNKFISADMNLKSVDLNLLVSFDALVSERTCRGQPKSSA